MYNTDTIILTAFSTVLEVSVYSVYNMVAYGLKKFIFTFTEHLEGAFGNMIAKKETDLLRSDLSMVETAIFGMSTIIFTSAGILILDFVRLYTRGISDTNYIRPLFAILMLLGQFINCIRLPYQLVVQAAGHYKQTKKGAIIEPILNISLSIIFVFKFGLIGVTVGTLVAVIFRTIQYSVYMSKNIIRRDQKITLYKTILSIAECMIIIIISKAVKSDRIVNYGEWIIEAIFVTIIGFIVVTIGNYLFNRNDITNLVRKINNIFRRKNKNNI